MARPLRIEYPGAVYHLTSRGNGRQKIFLNDADRLLFLDILAKVVERYNWCCHAYCLMDNHYHLLVETPDPNLSMGMRQLNGIYTQKFNFNHHRVGHVFQGRYKSILVDKESHLLELCRYIVLNPVAARMVPHPEKYQWSSYRYTAKQIKSPDFLHTDWLLDHFSKKKSKARKLYKEFVEERVDLSGPSPWKGLVGQLILGSEGFVEQIQTLLDNRKEEVEIPRQQRYAGRPSLVDLFSAQAGYSKAERNAQIEIAHTRYGYTLKDIGDTLGIHYSTGSKVINPKR